MLHGGRAEHACGDVPDPPVDRNDQDIVPNPRRLECRMVLAATGSFIAYTKSISGFFCSSLSIAARLT